jgi:hypothetical protein
MDEHHEAGEEQHERTNHHGEDGSGVAPLDRPEGWNRIGNRLDPGH